MNDSMINSSGIPIINMTSWAINKFKQAGAELGQAQFKLELDFTLIFFRFCLIELVGITAVSGSLWIASDKLDT